MRRHPLRVRDYLAHMLDAVSQIQKYAAGVEARQFTSNRLLQDGPGCGAGALIPISDYLH